MQMPAGITNSTVISCDIGENVAIHDVRYLAHYIIGDNVMLLNISEMHTTNHAKFGNCIVKDGEPEDVRVWLDLVNETGTRAVMAFDGMTAADAYLWARYRDDDALQRKLGEITQKQFDSRRGFYGTIGAGCVIKNSQILKDVKIGPACYIKGANKLKNLTINSSESEPTQIGEGVEIINGIIGFGCHVFYGCKAVRFVMGNNSNLKYGARLIHSYLGDNSTVSCCELLNNLIFPAHEQHHNNSFLTASLVLGQSNIAAGATVGSNHNSRANDGEIVAGRGFWPGLCTTLKHPCRFASFTLLGQGRLSGRTGYPAAVQPVERRPRERSAAGDSGLLVALQHVRPGAKHVEVHDPRQAKDEDAAYRVRLPRARHGRGDIHRPAAAGSLGRQGTASRRGQTARRRQRNRVGRRSADRRSPTRPNGSPELEILGENMEASRSPGGDSEGSAGVFRLPRDAALLCGQESPGLYASRSAGHVADDVRELAAPRERNWVNLGGQLVPEPDVERLMDDIKHGRLTSWERYSQAIRRTMAGVPSSETGPRPGGSSRSARRRRPDAGHCGTARWTKRCEFRSTSAIRSTRRGRKTTTIRSARSRSAIAEEMKAVLGTRRGQQLRQADAARDRSL